MSVTIQPEPAKPFPVIVGVSGHRDILPDALPALRDSLRCVLGGLRQDFGADAVCVLSALAKGADQLVAEIATAPDLGLRLIAVAPMPLDAYRATLNDDPHAAAAFDRLWSEAHLRLVLPWVEGNEQQRNHKLQYEQLGAVLSRYSHVLLALWDGQGSWEALATPEALEEVRGGTVHVLHLRRFAEREAHGFRHSTLFKDASSRLDLARGGPALHVVTPRQKTAGAVASGAGEPVRAGDCVLLRPYAKSAERPCDSRRIDRKLHEGEKACLLSSLVEESRQQFTRIRELNDAVRNFGRTDQAVHARQVGYLCPRDTAADPQGEAGIHLALLRNLQAGADAAAQRYQRSLLGEYLPATSIRSMLGKGWKIISKERRWPCLGVLLLFAALVPVTVLLFETYAHFGRSIWVLGGYVAAPILGFSVYHFIVERGEWQNRFQDYRALAEGMRVQIFWALAALPSAVSDHYLRLQRDELGWVQFALRGPALWAAALALELPEPCRQLVNECWIEDQCRFFHGDDRNPGRVALNETSLRRSTFWSQVFTGFGLGLSALLLVLEIIRRAGWASLPPHCLEAVQDWLLLLAAVAGGIAASFVISREPRAYEAHVQSYHALGGIFAKAKAEASKAPCTTDATEYQALVFDLGREALAENAAWLQDHRHRRIEHHQAG